MNRQALLSSTVNYLFNKIKDSYLNASITEQNISINDKDDFKKLRKIINDNETVITKFFSEVDLNKLYEYIIKNKKFVTSFSRARFPKRT